MMYIYPEKHTDNTAHSSSILAAQEQRLTQMFSTLNDQVGSDRYLLGDNISVCDYFLFMLCHWGSRLKQPPLQFSNLARCLKGLAATASFQEVCAIEGTHLDLYQ